MLSLWHVTKVLANKKQHPMKMRYLHHVVYNKYYNAQQKEQTKIL
jgi:hypothetical protein